MGSLRLFHSGGTCLGKSMLEAICSCLRKHFVFLIIPFVVLEFSTCSFANFFEGKPETIHERLMRYKDFAVNQLYAHAYFSDALDHVLTRNQRKKIPQIMLDTFPLTVSEGESIGRLLYGYGTPKNKKVIGIGHALYDLQQRAIDGDRTAYELLVLMGYPASELEKLYQEKAEAERNKGFLHRCKHYVKQLYQKVSPLETRKNRYQRMVKEGNYLTDDTKTSLYVDPDIEEKIVAAFNTQTGASVASGYSPWLWFFGGLLVGSSLIKLVGSMEGFIPLASHNFSDIQKKPDGNYYLLEDVELDSQSINPPLFNSSTPFTGTLLSGQGNESHSISGGYFNASTPDFSLMGSIDNSVVKANLRNFTFENRLDKTGAVSRGYTAILSSFVGSNNQVEATFENCSVTSKGKETVVGINTAAVFGSNNEIQTRTVGCHINEQNTDSSSYASGAGAVAGLVRGEANKFSHINSRDTHITTSGDVHAAGLSVGIADEFSALELRQKNISNSSVRTNGAHSYVAAGLAKLETDDFKKITISQENLKNILIQENDETSHAGVAIGHVLFYPTTVHEEKVVLSQQNLDNITLQGGRLGMTVGLLSPLTGNQIHDSGITQINVQGMAIPINTSEKACAASTINFDLCYDTGCKDYHMDFHLFSGQLVVPTLSNGTHSAPVVNTNGGNIKCTSESLWDTSGYQVLSEETTFDSPGCAPQKLDTHTNATAWFVARDALCQIQQCDQGQFCNYVNEEAQTFLAGPDNDSLLLLSRQRYPYNNDADAHGVLRLSTVVAHQNDSTFNETETTLYMAENRHLSPDSALVSHLYENNQITALYTSKSNGTELVTLPLGQSSSAIYQAKNYTLSGTPSLITEGAVWTTQGSRVHRYERTGTKINETNALTYELSGNEPVVAVTHDKHWLYAARVNETTVSFQRFNITTGALDKFWQVESQPLTAVSPDKTYSLVHENNRIFLLQKGEMILPVKVPGADALSSQDVLTARLEREGGCAHYETVPTEGFEATTLSSSISPSVSPIVTSSLSSSAHSASLGDSSVIQKKSIKSMVSQTVSGSPVISPVSSSISDGKKVGNNFPVIITGTVIGGVSVVVAVGVVSGIMVKKRCAKKAFMENNDEVEIISEDTPENPLYVDPDLLSNISNLPIASSDSVGRINGRYPQTLHGGRKKSKGNDITALKKTKVTTAGKNPLYVHPGVSVMNPVYTGKSDESEKSPR